MCNRVGMWPCYLTRRHTGHVARARYTARTTLRGHLPVLQRPLLGCSAAGKSSPQDSRAGSEQASHQVHETTRSLTLAGAGGECRYTVERSNLRRGTAAAKQADTGAHRWQKRPRIPSSRSRRWWPCRRGRRACRAGSAHSGGTAGPCLSLPSPAAAAPPARARRQLFIGRGPLQFRVTVVSELNPKLLELALRARRHSLSADSLGQALARRRNVQAAAAGHHATE